MSRFYRTRGRCAGLLAAVLMANVAAAESGVQKADYPASLVERPMILPKLMFQPTVEGTLSNNAWFGQSGALGGSLSIGLDVGLLQNLQVGVFFAFPLAPDGNFGDFLANLQVNLRPRVINLRFDVGTERFSSHGASLAPTDTFLAGVGLPLKIKLGRYVAITSGSTSARGFGTQQVMLIGSLSLYGSNALMYSNDVLAFDVSNNGHGSTVSVALHLPVGLVVQPHRLISIGVRTGYRLVYSTEYTALLHWIPLAFDLTFSARIIDLGFTAAIQGLVAGGSKYLLNGQPEVITDFHWQDLQCYTIWAGGRF